MIAVAATDYARSRAPTSTWTTTSSWAPGNDVGQGPHRDGSPMVSCNMKIDLDAVLLTDEFTAFTRPPLHGRLVHSAPLSRAGRARSSTWHHRSEALGPTLPRGSRPTAPPGRHDVRILTRQSHCGCESWAGAMTAPATPPFLGACPVPATLAGSSSLGARPSVTAAQVAGATVVPRYAWPRARLGARSQPVSSPPG